MDSLPPAALLRSLGVDVEAELPGASENQHWRVRRGETVAVLRRVSARSISGLSYELAVLRELDQRSWPVPVALVDPLESHGHTWVLYRWLPGESPVKEDRQDQRERGRLLGRLHDDLTQLVGLGQREGWRMAHELVADPDLHNALRRLARTHPAEAHLLRWHAERAVEMLAELPLAEAEQVVVQGDLAPWNLLFDEGVLTGIVDFDVAHLDLVVADFACSWRGKYDEVIRGYDEVRPLSDLDRELLTPVFWAWLFIGVADDLGAINAGTASIERLNWMMGKLPLRTPAMGPGAAPYQPLA